MKKILPSSISLPSFRLLSSSAIPSGVISFLVILFLTFAFAACGDDSASVNPNSLVEITSSSKSTGSVSSEVLKSSSSKKISDKVTSSNDKTEVKSSSSNKSSIASGTSSLKCDECTEECEGVSHYREDGKNLCHGGQWVVSCSEDREGQKVYIRAEENWCVCKNGFWNPLPSSSSVTLSSSSKYYDMSTLFVSDKNYSYGEFKDPRDGQVYKTIRYEYGLGVDSLTLFAENLNYGKMVPAGIRLTDSTKYCYDDDPWYCENHFGGLYTWATAMNFPAACDSFPMGSEKCPNMIDYESNPFPEFHNIHDLVIHQGICPDGWHVMNVEEWSSAVMRGRGSMDGALYVGGCIWGGGNQRGFSLLPAGILITRNPSDLELDLEYSDLRKYAYQWAPDENQIRNDDVASPYGLVVRVSSSDINRIAWADKVSGASVRCVMDY